MTEHDLLIDDDGIHFVYSDDLVDLFDGEDARTTRASHVEPDPRGGWIADMRPSGGPVLYANGADTDFGENPKSFESTTPFRTRQAALDAEREWLRKERGV